MKYGEAPTSSEPSSTISKIFRRSEKNSKKLSCFKQESFFILTTPCHNKWLIIPNFDLAGNAPRRNNLFVHIWNIILHQISAKFSDFFRSIAEEKVSALPKRKLRGVTQIHVRSRFQCHA